MNKIESTKTIATFSRGIKKTPQIKLFLKAKELVFKPDSPKEIDAVVGWGVKDNTKAAQIFAQKYNLPYLHLEDGFLRSIGLGVEGSAPLSLIIDNMGIYYNATGPSLLENILQNDSGLESQDLINRASNCIELITKNKLSKYNNYPIQAPPLPVNQYASSVLLIDQTANDMSILKGMVGPSGFSNMLNAAMDENPDSQIIIKTHPDVLAGKKRGCIEKIPNDPRVVLFSKSINPISLLSKVDRVYTATSQMGFEALMMGKKVTCFGAPFYSGWGITDDRVKISRRTKKRTLEQIFAAAYILYPSYINPDTGLQGEIEDVITYLARQREHFIKNHGNIFCYGFSLWKRHFVKAFLHCPQNKIYFVNSAKAAIKKGFSNDSKLLIWGENTTDDLDNLAQKHDVKTWKMEDGFLRSTGLGSDLAPPASLVIDKTGIYYNPTEPSDLEIILEKTKFTPEDLEDARELKQYLLESKISKYNVDGGERLNISKDLNKKIILVPGQVENDVSIKLGTVDIKTNQDLLTKVRQNNPQAYIIFKPHPDVISGNRKGAIPKKIANNLADAVLEDSSITYCLEICNEVHTMTSLVGFEGLLRDKKVVTYGRPFYSGWGLTEDFHQTPRRTRKLSLHQLIAGTLIAYPIYINTETMTFTTARYTAYNLKKALKNSKEFQGVKIKWHTRQLKKLLQLIKVLKHVN